MKKIKYAILGYTDVFNPETGEVEQKESIAYSIIDYSAEAEERIKETSYNGDYSVINVDEPEPVETTDDVLNALLGVTV